MKQKDIKIITHLRQNSRMPLTKMSRKTGIPISTIFDRLKTYGKNIVIKNTSLLNFEKLGYSARANMMIKTEKEQRENMIEFLKKHHRVNSVFRINNGFDFMIEGVFKQIKEMEEFIDQLESKFIVVERKTFFILEDVKREGFMTDVNLIF